MGVIEYIQAGVLAVFQGPAAFALLGVPVSVTLIMVVAGLLTGIVVGATPGLGQVIALAISLPILISVFGYSPDALLPVMGFMIGIMKGSTVGGAVPAILFNTPGTPDSYMTTLDGYPMTQNGQASKALRVAHFSSVSGDTFSDICLFIFAPFLAILVERFLDLPEKTALVILSLSFVATVVGRTPAKGVLSMALGLFFVLIGTGDEFHPRLTLGIGILSEGIPSTAAVVGVLVVGSIFSELEKLKRQHSASGSLRAPKQATQARLTRAEILRILPYISRSALIGTCIGALPGIGSTLAATLGYASGAATHRKRKGKTDPTFGDGVPEGVAATEAANSSVTGANLIPVLSLGIPGNTAAVFLILAADSIGGFTPGPSVFRFTQDTNPELVIAFGLFTTMVIANLVNWTVGGAFMRSMGVMTQVPRQYILPVVLLLTFTSLYVQRPDMAMIGFALFFGVLGFLMIRTGMSPLPFVIAFVLGRHLETTARQAFSATGGDPLFLFSSPLAILFMACAIAILVIATHLRAQTGGGVAPVADARE